MAGRDKVHLIVHKFGRGGTDRVCAYLANGLAKGGYDTEIVAFARGGDAEALLEELAGSRVRVRYLANSTGSRPFDLLRGLWRLAAHLRRERPACVVSTGNNVSWVTAAGVALSGLKSCKLALKTTNPIVRRGDGRFKRFWRSAGYRRAFAAADAVWTLSDAETRQLREAFPQSARRFQTVVNPYVTPAMLAPCAAACAADGRRHVIAVGRFSAQKRLDLLVRAFALVDDPKAHLTLLGEGPDRPMLQALVDALGLRDRVDMPGFVPDVAAWYRRAHVMVLPSVYEGLPAVVLEALASDCAVLATDCFPSARCLLEGVPGCAIIERPDPAELAARIGRSLAREKPGGLSAIARAYSIEAGVRSHAAALDKLLASPSASSQTLAKHARSGNRVIRPMRFG